jgi:hypothetical protein
MASVALLLVYLLVPPPVDATVTVYAAGDVAECLSTPAKSPAKQTAKLIPDDATVLVLGDAAYPNGDRKTFRSCYDPTWGRFRAHTYAVPGNHDYPHGTARDFLDYFGEHNGDHTWFRVGIGDWWLIGLDSNLGLDAHATQAAWLEQQLKEIAGDGRCIVAMWHHALYSTGLHAGDGKHMRAAWQALDKAGADIVLSGHEHFYESFEPRDADGRSVTSGIREFVVGTGGAQLLDISLSGGHRDFARVHGVLELVLAPDHYAYSFHTIHGETLDQGSAMCRHAMGTTHREQ